MDEFDGLQAVPAQAAEAAAALEALKAPAEQAARSIDEAFAKAGASLARSLSRAAADGRISLDELAAALAQAVGAAAGGGSVAGLFQAAGRFFGARADGGPVTAGGAYLVGERGPELFRPTSAGEIAPASPPGLTVNIQMQGEPRSALLRSEAQIAQALARAMRLGAR